MLDNIHGWVKPGMLGALMDRPVQAKRRYLMCSLNAKPMVQSMAPSWLMVDLFRIVQRMAGPPILLSCASPATFPKAEAQNGLSVEQRKRVTTGVELVSKPIVLILWTSLHRVLTVNQPITQSASSESLPTSVQAVLVTIANLLRSCLSDSILSCFSPAVGKTFYFEDIGDNGATIKRCSGRYGADCPAEADPAEFMIDVIWLESPEQHAMIDELDRTMDDAATSPLEQPEMVMSFHALWNGSRTSLSMSLHVISALLKALSFWRPDRFIAAYAPNPAFAALVNPLIISILVLFCSVFVPYTELNVFWKYWMYYLNPFDYVVSGMLTFGSGREGYL
ncbi:ATP-binding cassette transporter [Penicillium atrosanguineum]|nr:ATP-binding cassette transporter [Penicillium atrosanguineum]